MERRRRHAECRRDRGCEVLVGRRCEMGGRCVNRRRGGEVWFLDRVKRMSGFDMWAVGVVLLALVLCMDYSLKFRCFAIVSRSSGIILAM